MQGSETLRGIARRVIYRSVVRDLSTDDLHHVDAAGKRIGDRAEYVCRKRFVVGIFSTDAIARHFGVSEPVFGLVRRWIRGELDEMIEQDLESYESRARDRIHRTQLALRDRLREIRID